MKIKTLLLLSTIILPGITLADAFNAEIKVEYETWSSGLGGDSTALLGGLGLGYFKDKYFYGGGFAIGNYAIKGHSGDDLSRFDLDLVAGYHLQDKVSVFGGYRLNKMTFKSENGDTYSFDDTTHGLGGGASIYQSINKDWTAFGSLALSLLTSSTHYKDSSSDKGLGLSLGTEAGALYRINPKMNLAIRAKYQTSRINYESDNWPHSYFRLGVNLGYAF